MATESQLKKNYLWNTLGSFANALTSALLLIVVTRSLGTYMGGIFSLAYALGQQFQVLGAFEIRPYQATDTAQKYTFGTYLAARIITCAIMVLSLIAYAVYSNGLTTDAILLFGIAMLKFFDAFEDVYHGMFQQRGRLDIAGRAFFFRTIATFLSFSIGCVITADLGTACLFAIAISSAATVILNFPFVQTFEKNRPEWNWKAIGGLLCACLPLFLGVFLANDLINVPRYAIESYLTKDEQTVYAVINMPAMVINLLVGFVFKPLLSTLAESWNKEDTRAFTAVIIKGALLVIAVSIGTCILAYPFGVPALSFLYSIDLDSYKACLMIMLIGGTFNALSIIFYYALVTMRLQRFVLAGYAAAALSAHALSGPLVCSMGLMGVVVLYDTTMAIACIAFFALALMGYKASRRKLNH